MKGSVAPEYFLIPDLPETLQFGQSKPMIIGAGVYKFNFCKKQICRIEFAYAGYDVLQKDFAITTCWRLPVIYLLYSERSGFELD